MNRQNIRKLRRIRRQLKHVAIIAAAILIIAGGILVGVRSAKASAPAGEKIYTSVQIENGDTLWSIAERYAEGDTREYIDELRHINGIVNERGLRAGSFITVYYYL